LRDRKTDVNRSFADFIRYVRVLISEFEKRKFTNCRPLPGGKFAAIFSPPKVRSNSPPAVVIGIFPTPRVTERAVATPKTEKTAFRMSARKFKTLKRNEKTALGRKSRRPLITFETRDSDDRTGGELENFRSRISHVRPRCPLEIIIAEKLFFFFSLFAFRRTRKCFSRPQQILSSTVPAVLLR